MVITTGIGFSFKSLEPAIGGWVEDSSRSEELNWESWLIKEKRNHLMSIFIKEFRAGLMVKVITTVIKTIDWISSLSVVTVFSRFASQMGWLNSREQHYFEHFIPKRDLNSLSIVVLNCYKHYQANLFINFSHKVRVKNTFEAATLVISKCWCLS